MEPLIQPGLAVMVVVVVLVAVVEITLDLVVMVHLDKEITAVLVVLTQVKTAAVAAVLELLVELDLLQVLEEVALHRLLQDRRSLVLEAEVAAVVVLMVGLAVVAMETPLEAMDQTAQ